MLLGFIIDVDFCSASLFEIILLSDKHVTLIFNGAFAYLYLILFTNEVRY